MAAPGGEEEEGPGFVCDDSWGTGGACPRLKMRLPAAVAPWRGGRGTAAVRSENEGKKKRKKG